VFTNGRLVRRMLYGEEEFVRWVEEEEEEMEAAEVV
jgi:hypothetical protein